MKPLAKWRTVGCAIATFQWIPQKYLKALRGALDTLKEVVSKSTRKRDYLKASNKSVLYGFHTKKFSSGHDAKTNTNRVVKESEVDRMEPNAKIGSRTSL